ncbi:hypothetical protein F3I16_13210 [Pseudomonas sp. L-22-4S-12]|uniref:hypothetical protein n=1 Tax=Pseudomonas sp. L-22-4S-12 TaxID=2610893 RepID=UPI00132A58D9|nr:hypothetical protein [Pseudomonas sp. L-22-4S-12]MWV16997.1 hypothetical protein [Pseudomonas sp. L-22-4S-12]
MQNLNRKHHLFVALLLGSLITLGSASSFAADGSERLKLRAAPITASKLQRLAEDGSERSRLYRLKRHLDVVEGGSDRALLSRKA